MSILGIGTDIVEKARIEELVKNYAERFKSRILSEAEEQDSAKKNNNTDYLAKRFAGKEAVAKALGTGIGEKVAFHEISITNLPSGQPQVELLGKATQLMSDLKIKKIHISLSDEKDFVLAFVVIEAL